MAAPFGLIERNINWKKMPYLCRTVCMTFHSLLKRQRVNRRVGLIQMRRIMNKARPPPDTDVSRIRNIGIMAHIDAGKTTTTERMLYFSGTTKHLGDVDDGDTVTDYMSQERERGITITSAAVSLFWKDHRINLIDTPGHVDFTVEVERCLRVLDGAIAVFDASAGVEAQSITVWRQADHYHIPRIAFMNKMDKMGADFEYSVDSMKEKLNAVPLVLQAPIGSEKSFLGVVDYITMETITWDKTSRDDDGTVYDRRNLSDMGSTFSEQATHGRHLLVDQLADFDDIFAEEILSDNDYDPLRIPVQSIHSAIRRATLGNRMVPVLCGSSLKNKGVQLLMDAVKDYLPCPYERKESVVQLYKYDLCAYAFKVIHDKQRGALVFLRIYSGTLKAQKSIHNANQNCSEKVMRLLWVLADDFREVQSMSAGNIAVAVGLKQTVTGDTLVSSKSSYNIAKRTLTKEQKTLESEMADIREPVLEGMDIPEPVFFCSVEPPSQAYQADLDKALVNLQREDPSLKVTIDSDTGQTILSGMGELHLEIIRDRIIKEYKIDVELGPLQIAYRECVQSKATKSVVLDKTVGDAQHFVKAEVTVEPLGNCNESSKISLSRLLQDGDIELCNAAKNGVISSCSQGPLISYPLLGVHITVESLEVRSGTSMPMVSACITQAVNKCLQAGGGVILEPTMKVEIMTDEDHVSSVLGDLARRRGEVQAVESRFRSRVIKAVCPLAEMKGYATSLRSLTSGTASCSLEFSNYEIMSSTEQAQVIRDITGLS